MPLQIYEGLAKAKLYDVVYIAKTSKNSGTIVNSLTAYFKSWDKDYGLVHLTLARDTNRVITLSQGSISWIKDAITGELIYTKDPRAMVFGEAN